MKFNDMVSGGVLLALSLLILLTVKDYPDIPGQNIGPGANTAARPLAGVGRVDEI